jgi:hypothetical protein
LPGGRAVSEQPGGFSRKRRAVLCQVLVGLILY